MKARERELDEILSAYVDILNRQGPESPQELAYLEKHARDAEVSSLLRGARAIRALFDSFGRVPSPAEGNAPKRARKPKKTT